MLLDTTEDTIEEIFGQYAEVERVKKIKDYCFVHFATREGARKALQAMQGIFYHVKLFISLIFLLITNQLCLSHAFANSSVVILSTGSRVGKAAIRTRFPGFDVRF